MGDRAVAREQLRRLFQVLLALRGSRAPNSRDLASLCEVSPRTIYRDLSLLSQAGVPVRYAPERQGYQLSPDFRLDVPRLEEIEIVALAVLAWSCNDREALGLRSTAQHAVRKIITTSSEDSRTRLVTLFDHLGPGDRTVPCGPEERDLYRAILKAVATENPIRLEFHTEEARFPGAVPESCHVGVDRLFRVSGFWYLEGRSTAPHSVGRLLPLSRVLRASLTDDGLREPTRPARSPALPSWQVRLRFPEELGSAVRMIAGCGAVESPLDHGRIEIAFTVPALEPIQRWLLALGDQIEVLAPPELRNWLVNTAREVIRRQSHLAVLDADGTERPWKAQG